jgi:hypothetical protein
MRLLTSIHSYRVPTAPSALEKGLNPQNKYLTVAAHLNVEEGHAETKDETEAKKKAKGQARGRVLRGAAQGRISTRR